MSVKVGKGGEQQQETQSRGPVKSMPQVNETSKAIVAGLLEYCVPLIQGSWA